MASAENFKEKIRYCAIITTILVHKSQPEKKFVSTLSIDISVSLIILSNNMASSGNNFCGNSSLLHVNKTPFMSFLENFLPTCSFYEYLNLFCSSPDLIKQLSHLTFHEIDTNDLNLTDSDFKKENELLLLNNLNNLVPDIKKLSVSTKRFESNVNDILRTIANFRNLENLYIIFDSVHEKQFLRSGFSNLKHVSIIINKAKIENINKSKYLVNNVIQLTTNLISASFSNVIVNSQVLLSLSYNIKLKSISFANCNFEGPSLRFRHLLKIIKIERVLVYEFGNVNNTKPTELVFKLIPSIDNLRKLKGIAFNVFDDELIKYGNINLCTELESVTLIYFNHITPSFVRKFKDVINMLYSMVNPPCLKIITVEMRHSDGDDEDYVKKSNEFKEYIEELEIYFGEIDIETLYL